MARFGIATDHALGIGIPALRSLAREIGRDHALAQELWATGLHEARILASMIDDPALVDARQMERWARDFDSWDLCDQTCGNLFRYTRLAYVKAVRWSRSEREFTKRAGFALMAALAISDKGAPDGKLKAFLPLIIAGATDERNFVRKAVNWALRQIGKRNPTLHRAALLTSERLVASESRSARWVGADARRELLRVGSERAWR